MALTQMQLIQSLGEAMTWFERELQWGVRPTELRHLCGRIGELYAALITNGQMAIAVNQKGYDVVSAEGERISVKTTAIMNCSGHVSFNSNSLDLVDRIIVLRINTEDMEIETLLNAPVAEAKVRMVPAGAGKLAISLTSLVKKSKPRSDIKTIKETSYKQYKLRELESGTIEVEKDGILISPTKPLLRKLALEVNIPIVNSNGNAMTTRQLGSLVIKSLDELRSSDSRTAPERAIDGSK